MQRAVRTAVFIITCVGSVTVPRTIHTQSASCLVSTLNGPVQGADSGDSCVFAGIPYAAPPLGELRWKPPQPAPAWTFLNANNTQSNCPSIRLPERVLTGNEDCLKLNVWVRDPLPTVPAPVIVWLHTGAFFGGSANLVFHNPQRLVLESGAIVVMPNYRHGPFGFLAHSALTAEDPLHPASGNYGLMDQRAALEWVRHNIAQFGGDPQNVTLAGTSAGGESVGLHLVSPASGGLFHRAIVQSAAVTVRWPDRAEAESQGAALATALGCTGSDVLSCMRSRSRNEVLLALSQGTQQVAARPEAVYWMPIVDGLEIPDQPRYLFESGSLNRVPTIVGTNRDEAWGPFVTRSFPVGPDSVQYEAWVFDEFGSDAPGMLATYPPPSTPSAAEQMARLANDVQFVCEARRLARLIERTKTPTYVYSYDYEIDGLVADHVIHGVESNILFGNDYSTPAFPANHPLAASDFALHSAMAGYWTRFAKTGHPNSDDKDVVHWPAFKHPTANGRGSDKHLVLDLEVREAQRLREQQCDFLEPYFFRSILASVPASTP
jgi:para-nitrobenzyl esterase